MNWICFLGIEIKRISPVFIGTPNPPTQRKTSESPKKQIIQHQPKAIHVYNRAPAVYDIHSTQRQKSCGLGSDIGHTSIM